MIEQTLSIIKPDAVERNLENKIKDFFEKNNLTISHPPLCEYDYIHRINSWYRPE